MYWNSHHVSITGTLISNSNRSFTSLARIIESVQQLPTTGNTQNSVGTVSLRSTWIKLGNQKGNEERVLFLVKFGKCHFLIIISLFYLGKRNWTKKSELLLSDSGCLLAMLRTDSTIYWHWTDAVTAEWLDAETAPANTQHAMQRSIAQEPPLLVPLCLIFEYRNSEWNWMKSFRSQQKSSSCSLLRKKWI